MALLYSLQYSAQVFCCIIALLSAEVEFEVSQLTQNNDSCESSSLSESPLSRNIEYRIHLYRISFVRSFVRFSPLRNFDFFGLVPAPRLWSTLWSYYIRPIQTYTAVSFSSICPPRVVPPAKDLMARLAAQPMLSA